MQLARKALDASANVELSSNEMLWGFEADIVIRVYDGAHAQSSPEALQAYHQRGDRRPKACHARTRGFTQRRDEHLRLASARVVRWDLMSREQQKKGTMRSCRTFEI
jgi:hypothetical protein